MTFIKVGIIGGIVILGILIWMAIIGVAIAAEVLITVFVLVALVGGGNWLSGRRTGRTHGAPPLSSTVAPADGTDAGADPGPPQ